MKNAQQSTPPCDLLAIHKFSELLKSADMRSQSDVERLRKMIGVVGIVCSVRQGSRLLVNGMLFTHCILGLFRISNFTAIHTIRCSPSYDT